MAKRKTGRNRRRDAAAARPTAGPILQTPAWDAASSILRRPWIVPAALFLISFVFRLYYMNEGLFHHDEVLLAQAVESTWEKLSVAGEFNGRYGAVLLNTGLYAPWKALTGMSSEKIIPFVSVLTGALLVASVYLLAVELSGEKLSASLAALFFGFNFLFLTTSTTGKENTPQLFFAVLSMVLFVKGAKGDSRVLKIAAFAVFSFSLAVHEAGIALIPVFLSFMALFEWIHAKGKRILLLDFVILAAFVAIPFILFLGSVLFQQLAVKSTHTVGFEGIFSPVLGRSGADLMRVTGIPLAALAVAGMAALRNRGKALVPLVLWILLFFYFGNVSSYAPRYLIYTVVPLTIIAGIGAGSLIGKLPRTGMQAAACLILAALICGTGIYNAYPLIAFRKDYCGPKRMAQFVGASTEPDALVVTMDESVFIDYYGKRKVMGHPVADYSENRTFVENLRRMALSGKKIYVNSTAFSYDYQRHFETFMLGNFDFKIVGEVQDEDYHRPELSFAIFTNRLFRVFPK
jgi:hypothetical protein